MLKIEVSQYSFDYEIPAGVNFNYQDFYNAIVDELEYNNVCVVGVDTNRDDIDWDELSNLDMHQCGIDFIDLDRKFTGRGADSSVEKILKTICREFGVTVWADDYDSTEYYGIEKDVADFYNISVDRLIRELGNAGYPCQN